MVKKKGAIAAKARAKREAREGVSSENGSCLVATGPILPSDGKRVHRGLMNLGNTCFMNSVIQCLNVTVPFSDDLLRLAADGLDGMSGSLCTVMRGIRAVDDTAACLQKFSPKSFHTQLVEQFPWYYGKQQHDAHEFLRTLLGSVSDERTIAERDAIENQINSSEGLVVDLDAPSSCERCVGDNFKGHLLAASLCWSCGHVTVRSDPFLDLSLELPMPSGTCRKPLGITPACEAGKADLLQEEVFVQQTESAPAADGPLAGHWAASRELEELAAIREVMPMLVPRIIINVLEKQLLRTDLIDDSVPLAAVSLSRQSKKGTPQWGFRWNEAKFKRSIFIVGGIVEDSSVDKWNLKRLSTGSADRAVYPGDWLVEVNGTREFAAMHQELKKANELELRFVRRSEGDSEDVKLHDETDDEAEELRATLAAAQNARRRDFLQTSSRCFDALPSDLQQLFGAVKTRQTSTGQVDLQDCLEQLSLVEALEDEYQPVYSCATCMSTVGCRTFASRRFWLWPAGLPPVLTVQLKRFRRYASDYVKSLTSVALPAVLDLSDNVLTKDEFERLRAHGADTSDFEKLAADMETSSAGSLCYELYGVCEHLGTQMQEGHYGAYVNVGPSLDCEDWLGISDAKMWKCARSDVLKAEAYIAFYRRVESHRNSPEAVEESSQPPQDAT